MLKCFHIYPNLRDIEYAFDDDDEYNRIREEAPQRHAVLAFFMANRSSIVGQFLKRDGDNAIMMRVLMWFLLPQDEDQCSTTTD